MNLTTVYKAMRKKASDFLPATPNTPLGTGVQTTGLPSSSNSAAPKLPPGQTPEQAMNTASVMQGGAAPEATETDVAQLTSALNKITDVAKATLKGKETPVAATNAGVSATPSGNATPLPKMAAAVKKALEKRAASIGSVPDKAATTVNAHGLRADYSSPQAQKHHYYPMLTNGGRPVMPKIQELGGAQSDVHKEIPRVMEYEPKTNRYVMHQYPYAKKGYPTSSTEQRTEAEKLLTPGATELPAASKANYQDMVNKGTFAPATALQYAEYLKWRKATGGKTNPVSK